MTTQRCSLLRGERVTRWVYCGYFNKKCALGVMLKYKWNGRKIILSVDENWRKKFKNVFVSKGQTPSMRHESVKHFLLSCNFWRLVRHPVSSFDKSQSKTLVFNRSYFQKILFSNGLIVKSSYFLQNYFFQMLFSTDLILNRFFSQRLLFLKTLRKPLCSKVIFVFSKYKCSLNIYFQKVFFQRSFPKNSFSQKFFFLKILFPKKMFLKKKYFKLFSQKFFFLKIFLPKTRDTQKFV